MIARMGWMFALVLGVTGLAEAAAPPARLTAEQMRLLYQRDRLGLRTEQAAQAGKLDEAVELCSRALRLQRRVCGDTDAGVVNGLRALAGLEEARGAWLAAIRAGSEAAAVVARLHGDDHWKSVDSRLDLSDIRLRARLSADQRAALVRAGRLQAAAEALTSKGKVKEALPPMREVMRLRKEVLGEKHPRYAGSLNNLALLLKDMGEHKKALPLFQQAMRLCKEVLGEKHPNYTTGLTKLARLYLENGRPSAALALAGQALAIQLAFVEDSLGVVDDRQRLLLLGQVSWTLSLFTTLAEADVAAGEVYRWVLRLKGVHASRSRLDALARDNPNVEQLLLELQSARAALARLVQSTPPPDKLAQWRARFDEQESRKGAAQERLARLCKQFARMLHKPGAGEVVAVLPGDCALVEFLAYWHPFDDPSHPGRRLWKPRLLAFVLRRGQGVVMVPLGRAEAVDAAIRSWRASVAAGRAPDTEVAAFLRRRLWLAIEKHLGGVKTVLIAPDGELASLPFAALPGKKIGSFLIEEYAFALVPSGRQLLDPPADKEARGLLCLGGVSFGAAAKGKKPSWRDLPGTAVEAEEVFRLFTDRFKEVRARRLLGKAADRNGFLAATGTDKQRWRYLHLATHGFFAPARRRLSAAVPAAGAIGVAATAGLPGAVQALAALLAVDDPDVLDRQRGFDPTGREARILGRNPLLATGLVLAGANSADSDSVLTAEEIAGLDLRGFELAVLSACETALGKQEGYQGVMGLQRAFHDAGVQSLVASLWSVSDAATSVLMEEFYKQLWDKKQSPMQALRQAQLFVLKHPQGVRQRAAELRELLVKRGIGEEALQMRGLGKKALPLPEGSSREKRSPPAWWASWVLSGTPVR
jgi:CHAT domain-containing protein/tetratricopeptide (TPR) repeat protein